MLWASHPLPELKPVLIVLEISSSYVLFFLHLESRRVTLGGITRHPTEAWMTQIARNAVEERSGCLRACRYLLHDRDSKVCGSFKDVLRSEGVSCLALPPQSPNLNAFAERWVRSVRQGCLSKLIVFGEGALQRERIHTQVAVGTSIKALGTATPTDTTDTLQNIVAEQAGMELPSSATLHSKSKGVRPCALTSHPAAPP